MFELYHQNTNSNVFNLFEVSKRSTFEEFLQCYVLFITCKHCAEPEVESCTSIFNIQSMTSTEIRHNPSRLTH